jgi:hypothetical protein
MTFLAANDNFSYINFGDDGAADRGTIRYGHSADSFSFQTAATEAMVIDSTGAVTKPLQPAFSANPSGVQSNIGDNTIIAFATEIFDIGANFASNTFTAPVTGKYLLSANVRIDNLDLDGAYHALTINTSNRAYYALHGSAHWDADANYYFFSFSILADMDANDTAYLLYNENSSQADQADVSTSSYFTGFLAC